MNKYLNEYMVVTDNGHDLDYNTFYSWYRAGSNQNREDAKKFLNSNYNSKRYIGQIKEIYLWERSKR